MTDGLTLDDVVEVDGETTYWVRITEWQVAILASGCVPKAVQAMARTLLNQQAIDQARADRPLVKVRKKAR